MFSSHEFDLHKTAANLPRTQILKYLLSLSHVVDKHIRSIAVLGDTKHERFILIHIFILVDHAYRKTGTGTTLLLPTGTQKSLRQFGHLQ